MVQLQWFLCWRNWGIQSNGQPCLCTCVLTKDDAWKNKGSELNWRLV